MSQTNSLGDAAESGAGLHAIGQRPSRTQEVFEALQLAIARRDLAPGSLHSAAELAETFGVSRTPVREALIDLASRGIIRFERNRGVRILRSTADDLREIFELRHLLEVHAARVAATSMSEGDIARLRAAFEALEKAGDEKDDRSYWAADRTFHHMILHAAGNERLTNIIGILRESILVPGATSAGRTRSLTQITDEHRVILSGIASGDPDQAAEAMRVHLQNTAENLISQEEDAER
ncbi:GntR family transcriptional regulator [Microbacterium esteraromaticum]|uniref:GntR family transcriptional regulator n=1 Tax=Microbacterium esteraromaticum TaxID=57043 RepID=A0A7D7WF42_9MICO|nr:GntR family transcriptional regulator [Microbacterium esteraromaticum]QMU95914.1 GntR family transcriptional regulator [Microbacterium esteraromaticum]